MDDWFFDEVDGMNEGVSSDDERTSLWVLDYVFLVFLQFGGGNSNGGIPNFSLCDLVSVWEEGNWEETPAWDNSDSSWDIEIPCNLQIKYCTLGVSIEEDWSDFFGISVVDTKDFFTTSRLGFWDLECDREVGVDGEGVLLLEWFIDLYFLTIHS